MCVCRVSVFFSLILFSLAFIHCMYSFWNVLIVTRLLTCSLFYLSASLYLYLSASLVRVMDLYMLNMHRQTLSILFDQPQRERQNEQTYEHRQHQRMNIHLWQISNLCLYKPPSVSFLSYRLSPKMGRLIEKQIQKLPS